VNKYSGRSFNDMMQYPIFPWVIKDYNSPPQTFWAEFNQQSKATEGRSSLFRNFKKATGAMSKRKREEADKEWRHEIEEVEREYYGDERFQLRYGYSNILTSLGFLQRLEPFTSSHIEANGQLESPNRMFYNFAKFWNSIKENPQSNAELVPELFYMPEVLKN